MASPLLWSIRFATCCLCFVGSLAQELAESVHLEETITGLGEITDIQSAGDGRLFVADKAGFIRIVEHNGDTGIASVRSTPFLDISNRVKNSGERGFLGMAFHPNFDTNGFFFVNYIYDDSSQADASCGGGDSGDAKDTRISRFTVSTSNPNIADEGSELVVAVLSQPYCNHNGGQLLFGRTDGFLYIGLGDGGSGNDPGSRSLDLSTLLGKILRVDINGMDESATTITESNPRWRIPPSNPFRNNAGARDEIWFYGLRNPWRFSFDRLTGDTWIADVGQSAREEVNFIAAGTSFGGESFGWRACEGTLVNIAESLPVGCNSCADSSCSVPPVIEYGRTQGISVTGGYVYRGKQYAAQLGGIYFYADFSGTLWGARSNGAGTWTNIIEVDFPNTPYSTFGEDANGEVYVGSLDGILYRIKPLPVWSPIGGWPPGSITVVTPPAAAPAATPPWSPIGELPPGTSIVVVAKTQDVASSTTIAESRASTCTKTVAGASSMLLAVLLSCLR